MDKYNNQYDLGEYNLSHIDLTLANAIHGLSLQEIGLVLMLEEPHQ